MTTGITQNEPGRFSLFPNPACNSITIDLPHSGKLKIYDLTGRVLNESTFSTAGVHQLPLTFTEKFVLLQFIGHNGSNATMKLIRECP